METKKIIKKLCSFGERQLENEKKAYELITFLLKNKNIKFTNLSFTTKIPLWEKYSLFADGKKIKCLPTGLKSGKINSNSNLISSRAGIEDCLYLKNINFNPSCSSISKARFYYAPAIAINRGDVLKVCKSKKIEGVLKVKKINHKTNSILVGNLKNPKNIIFSHFDSIEIGAIDNASGTALCLNLCLENIKLLKNNLFVFDSNEEISYDEPISWGYGYREFEKKYLNLLKKCENIFVVDCIGHSNLKVFDSLEIIKLAFPIKNINTFSKKIKILSGDINKLMEVYQSPIDKPNLIKGKYLDEVKSYLENKIKN